MARSVVVKAEPVVEGGSSWGLKVLRADLPSFVIGGFIHKLVRSTNGPNTTRDPKEAMTFQTSDAAKTAATNSLFFDLES